MTAPALFESAEPTSEVELDSPAAEDGGAVLAELLVEEISIDGMCGVY
jgi:mycofactocin precursor